MAFFGKYLEVTPHSRLVWTNEEAGDNGAVSTVTFEEQAGKTVVVMSDFYPSKAAFDENSGAEAGLSETFEQLEEFIATLSASES
jgi:uncharacterized protein YndB with AHSA1/START domain